MFFQCRQPSVTNNEGKKGEKKTQTGPGIGLTSSLLKFSQLISLAKAKNFHNPISNHLLSSSSCLIICIRPISKHTARQGQLGSTYPSRPSYLETGKNYFKNNLNRFQQVKTTDENPSAMQANNLL